MNLKSHFSRFLDSDPTRLHVAAHSHHPWPDVTFEAQQRAWLDAADLQDDKWDRVFGEVVPEAQGHAAALLGLESGSTFAFAPNTHEFLVRLLSCLPTPSRILTTDAEFHSLSRQARRLEEEGLAEVERVAAEPFASFPDRFAQAARTGGRDLVFFSQVHYNSGYATPDLDLVVGSVPDERTFVVIDGYHGFMALPTDLSALGSRVFYLTGGYKYAMAGEGAGLLHCPPGYAPRPVNTGWFAGFGQLRTAGEDRVGYAADGSRFLGATFDPTGLYRFNAVQRWLGDVGLTVDAIHEHVRALQQRFLERLDALALGELSTAALLPPVGFEERGNFLTFRFEGAADAYRRLHHLGVITDHRADRLRIGFGVYHDADDVDDLCARLTTALGARN